MPFAILLEYDATHETADLRYANISIPDILWPSPGRLAEDLCSKDGSVSAQKHPHEYIAAAAEVRGTGNEIKTSMVKLSSSKEF